MNNINIKMKDIAIKEYQMSGAISLVILTILLTLFLISKIQYGNKVITKLTLKPYFVALAYLISLLTYSVFSDLHFEMSTTTTQENI